METISAEKNGYQFVQKAVRERIIKGEWRPGCKIPSERELGKEFSLNRLTISKGLVNLANEGLLVRRRGQGTFVAERGAEVKNRSRLVKFISPVGSGENERLTVRHGMLEGVYESLRECGYNVGIDFYKSPQEQVRMLREEEDGGCSGVVIWYDPKVDLEGEYQRLWKKNFPFVLVDACSKEYGGDFVGTDNVEGGNLMVEYLVRRGHRQIGYVTRPVDRSSLRDRQTGVLQGAVNFGLPFGAGHVAILGHSEGEALGDVAGSVERLLSANPGMTAIIFGNDDLALAGMDYLAGRGIKVPETLSVMGYDNIDRSEYEGVPLTTVMQDFYQIGKTAGEILNERIEGGTEGRGIREYVHPKLVERSSVKRLDAESGTASHK